jgi:hypothetical protein
MSGNLTSTESIWKGWVIVQEPGLIPYKKGPWRRHKDITEMIFALQCLYPDARLTVARVTDHGHDMWLDTDQDWIDQLACNEGEVICD